MRLPRLIGLSRALDMILTGRPVSASEAFMFGLANKVVPSGQARETAIAMVICVTVTTMIVTFLELILASI